MKQKTEPKDNKKIQKKRRKRQQNKRKRKGIRKKERKKNNVTLAYAKHYHTHTLSKIGEHHQ